MNFERYCGMAEESVADQLDYLFARQVALEAMFVHAVAPVLMKVVPDLALALVEGMRTGLHVRSQPGNARLVLLTEEYIQALADQIERKIRASAA
jgi:hypothetical protein